MRLLLILVIFAISIVPTYADQMTYFDAEKNELSTDSLISKLRPQRAVFVGEIHDRYDHHLNQLTVIKHLTQHSANWAIGLEWVQQPFQAALDRYIAGELSERELLIDIEYYDRWGYDYRLLRPIFEYAKEQGIPLIALNIDRNAHRKVGADGIAGLSDEERALLPQEIDKSNTDYRERLQAIFKHHPNATEKAFENFWEAQLVWDESMAERAADYLIDNPTQSMIILAGRGHIEYGDGIPDRLHRRLPTGIATVLSTDDSAAIDDAAHYWITSAEQRLPASGKMGIMLDLEEGVSARSVLADSAAEKAGVQDNDRIVAIDSQTIATIADLRLALLDKIPGDSIVLSIQRDQETMDIPLVLAE